MANAPTRAHRFLKTQVRYNAPVSEERLHQDGVLNYYRQAATAERLMESVWQAFIAQGYIEQADGRLLSPDGKIAILND